MVQETCKVWVFTIYTSDFTYVDTATAEVTQINVMNVNASRKKNCCMKPEGWKLNEGECPAHVAPVLFMSLPKTWQATIFMFPISVS